jgi:hypothetical protein
MIILWWLTSLAATTGSILNIKKNRWCFIIWCVTNLFWGTVDFIDKNPRCLFFVFSFFVCIWGFKQWSKREVV